MEENFYLLSNGNKIPKIGLGTDDVFFINPPRSSSKPIVGKVLSAYNRKILKPFLNHQMTNRFVKAFNAGYRLIDTSAAYHNEESIGNAVKKSGIPRELFFLTSRCTNKMQFEKTVGGGYNRLAKQI